MEPKFKIGDIVQLKSGGAKMTITGRINNKSEPEKPEQNKPERFYYHCSWFENGIFRENDKYVKYMLERNIDVRQSTFMEQLSQQQTARFQENAYMFTGFELVERNIREYNIPVAGIALGYIGEVSPEMLKRTRYLSYRQGDYAGLSGLEWEYEEVLRGQRGVHYLERDKFNRPRDPYKAGSLDTQEIAGSFGYCKSSANGSSSNTFQLSAVAFPSFVG